MENANRPTSPEVIHLQKAISAARKMVDGVRPPLPEAERDIEPEVFPQIPTYPAPTEGEQG
jgi:hypothetical protein